MIKVFKSRNNTCIFKTGQMVWKNIPYHRGLLNSIPSGEGAAVYCAYIVCCVSTGFLSQKRLYSCLDWYNILWIVLCRVQLNLKEPDFCWQNFPNFLTNLISSRENGNLLLTLSRLLLFFSSCRILCGIRILDKFLDVYLLFILPISLHFNRSK